MSQFQVKLGETMTLRYGSKGVRSEDYLPNNFVKSWNIYLESDIIMLKNATHKIRCDIEVYVPNGYMAKVMTHECVFEEKEVFVIGDYIEHGSHYKRISFFIVNTSDSTTILKKGDIIGKLCLFESPNNFVPFNVIIL